MSDTETRTETARRIIKEADAQRLSRQAELEQDRTSNRMNLPIGEHELRIRVLTNMSFSADLDLDRVVGSVVSDYEGISQYELLEKILQRAMEEQRIDGKLERLNPAQCELTW